MMNEIKLALLAAFILVAGNLLALAA